MKYNRTTRRMFLQGSGTALAIPFLESLLPRAAWAQTAPVAPKRFISVLTEYDYGHHANWFPNPSGDITNLVQPNRIYTPTGTGDRPIHWQPLREFAPTNSVALSRILGSGLSPYLESMNLLRGLDYITRDGHDSSRVLGGMPGALFSTVGDLRLTPTIDHVINNNRAFNPAGLPLMYIGTSGGAGTYWSMAPYKTSSVPATNIGGTMQTIFNALFANGNQPEAGQPDFHHPKADILNRVLGDFTRVRNSKNISSGDKASLDNAVDKLSDVLRGLTRVATPACKYKQLVPTGEIYQIGMSATVGKLLADMVSASIMCDTARTFTIGADIPYDVFDGESFDHQTTSHQPFVTLDGKVEWVRMGDRHAAIVANFLAPLIQNLASANDPVNGKSFLYNSLILKSSESSQVHGWGSQPALLIGNAGGAIQSGNYIDYSDRTKPYLGCDSGNNLFTATPGDPLFSNNYYGVIWNRLLVNILQGMGLTPADYENNSDNAQLCGRTDIGAQNSNLTSLGGYGHAFRWDLARGDAGIQEWSKEIQNYDLKTFRYKLPMV